MTQTSDVNGGTSEKDPLKQAEQALEVAEEGNTDEDTNASASKAGAAAKEPKTIPGLATLKQYKELVAIILFFGMGIIWLYTAFATKHYVASIRCLLGTTIERIDNEAQARVLQDEIVDRNARVEELKTSNATPTAPLILQIEKLKAEIDGLKHKKMSSEEIISKSSSRLLNGECDK